MPILQTVKRLPFVESDECADRGRAAQDVGGEVGLIRFSWDNAFLCHFARLQVGGSSGAHKNRPARRIECVETDPAGSSFVGASNLSGRS